MPLGRPRRWPAALLALSLPLEACGGGPMVRVRVPLTDNPGGELAAERCVFDCGGRSPRGSSEYAECLSTCPGAEVSGGERCEAGDRAPRAVCVESDRDPAAEYAEADGGEGEGDGGGRVGAAIVSFLFDLIGAAARVGGQGKSGGGRHASAHHAVGGGRSGGSRASSGHVSASPSKGHRAASPSKGPSKGHVRATPKVK